MVPSCHHCLARPSPSCSPFKFQIVTVSFLRIGAQTPLAFLIAVIYLLGAVTAAACWHYCGLLWGPNWRSDAAALMQSRRPGKPMDICPPCWTSRRISFRTAGQWRPVEIVLRPDDRDGLLAASLASKAISIGASSPLEKLRAEIAFFVNVDTVSHVAWS
jgi:hypothetical protein